MLLNCFPGETVRLSAKGLTHSDQGPVTSGATVTIALYNPDGTLNTQLSGGNVSGSPDWYADFTAPNAPGTYAVKITAVASGATAKAKDAIAVVAF